MHNCHSTARCPSLPPPSISPTALDPRPITQRQPSPTRTALLPSPSSRRMLPSARLQAHSAAAPLTVYALFIATTRPAALGPRCRRQGPRAATTLGLVFISARTGNDSLQQLPWLGPAPRLVASSTVGPNSLALARGRVPSTETISNPAQRDAAAHQVCHLMFFFLFFFGSDTALGPDSG